MISKDRSRELLSVARQAAVLSGEFLIGANDSARKINSESGKDIKIAADLASEKVIIDYLKEKTDFPILSEEAGLISGDKQELSWVVDPLDGSYNYLRKIPFCCVSIGLWRGDKPVLGVVYEFNQKELFSGIAGEGAWLNDAPIKVSNTKQKEKAVLCTGFPVNADFSQKAITDFIENSRSYKKVRLIGSAALSIAYVACGRADVYSERGIMFWDIAGAIPILLAAGGESDMEKAAKEYSYNVFSRNGVLTG